MVSKFLEPEVTKFRSGHWYNDGMKRVCLCGSMSVVSRMLEIRDVLEANGVIVETPSLDEPNDYSVMSEVDRARKKSEMIRRHLERIKKSEAILVVNETTKGVENYIGANTFLEMGMAFALEKQIFILHSIPQLPNRDELLGLNPTELKGDIRLLYKL